MTQNKKAFVSIAGKSKNTVDQHFFFFSHQSISDNYNILRQFKTVISSYALGLQES